MVFLGLTSLARTSLDAVAACKSKIDDVLSDIGVRPALSLSHVIGLPQPFDVASVRVNIHAAEVGLARFAAEVQLFSEEATTEVPGSKPAVERAAKESPIDPARGFSSANAWPVPAANQDSFADVAQLAKVLRAADRELNDDWTKYCREQHNGTKDPARHSSLIVFAERARDILLGRDPCHDPASVRLLDVAYRYLASAQRLWATEWMAINT